MDTLLAPDLGAVIKVDGECYERIEIVEGPPDITDAPEYETCEECAEAVSGSPSTGSEGSSGTVSSQPYFIYSECPSESSGADSGGSTAPSAGASSTGGPSTGGPSTAPSDGGGGDSDPSSEALFRYYRCSESSQASGGSSSLPEAPSVTCPIAFIEGSGTHQLVATGGAVSPPYCDPVTAGLAIDTQLSINRAGFLSGAGISSRTSSGVVHTSWRVTDSSSYTCFIGYKQYDTTVFDWGEPVAIQLSSFGDFTPGTTAYLFYTTSVVDHGTLTLNDILTGWTNGGALPNIVDGLDPVCRDIRSLVPNSDTLTLVVIDDFTLNGTITGLVSPGYVRLKIHTEVVRGTML